MKIKTKKEMTLPQLIQWTWENGIKHKEFAGSRNGIAEFDFRGWVRTDLIEPDETFTVEVEEEITEETEIPKIVEVVEYKNGELDTILRYNFSIKEYKKYNEDFKLTILTFYMLNDDGTLTLLWKDGELIK